MVSGAMIASPLTHDPGRNIACISKGWPPSGEQQIAEVESGDATWWNVPTYGLPLRLSSFSGPPPTHTPCQC